MLKRGDGRVALLAAGVLAAVGLLDFVTPPDADFGEFYVICVVIAAWGLGWGVGTAFALLATVLKLTIDANTGALVASSIGIFLWNALSDFLVFAVVAFVTDRAYVERERWRVADAERRLMLRLLEQELPRPLRAADWFARTFEDAVGGSFSESVRVQFAALRRHTRESLFLALDLLAIGNLGRGMRFQREPVHLNALVSEAAADTLDRTRVLLSLTSEDLMGLADPDRLRHAVSSVLSRCLDLSPYEQVTVLTRRSGDEVAIEISSRSRPIEPSEVELATLLVEGNGGRIVTVPRYTNRGSQLTIYVPRFPLGQSSATDEVEADLTAG